MQTEPMNHDYHFSGIFYFDKGSELSGSTLARLWSGTNIYGKHKVRGAFWRDARNMPKPPKFRLGSLEHITPLLEVDESTIYGGGMCVESRIVKHNSIINQDFYYGNISGSRQFGCYTDPMIIYSISGKWFERTGPETVLNHMYEHFEAADAVGSPYGFLDLSLSEDCYGGMAFVDAGWIDNIPQHRWVDEIKWVHARSRKKPYARGLYWGNYFGKAMLDQMGGRERFLASYRSQIDGRGHPPFGRVWEFKNGVFVSICTDPLKCRPGLPVDGAIGGNMDLLLHELGTGGLLSPW